MTNLELFRKVATEKIAAADLPQAARTADSIFSGGMKGKPVAAKWMPSLVSDKQKMGDDLINKMRSSSRLQGSQFGNTLKNITGKFRLK